MHLKQLTEIRKAGTVKRFHTRDTIKTDTVANHSHNVALILMCMGEYSENLLAAALLHDLPERKTGDIPSPVKRTLPVKVVEAWESGWWGRYGKLNENIGQLTPDELVRLKVADNLDGLMFCIDEISMGNVDLVSVGDTYCTYLEDESHPLVGQAIEKFKRVKLWLEIVKQG